MLELSGVLKNKKLIFVTGKGGSGKSSIAAALAHYVANTTPLRVWLVEIGRKIDLSFSRLPQILSVPAIGHEPTQIKTSNFQACILDPVRCLSEYVDLKIPTGGLAGLLLNNRVTASLLEVVPGLPDLVALGKIHYALTHPKNPLSPDVLILDAPATGHAKALLETPKNFRKITKTGPIYKDAVKMEEFLTNKNDLLSIITCLPEEMVLQETHELYQYLEKNFGRPTVLMNRCFPKVDKLASKNVPEEFSRLYNYAHSRFEREQAALSEAPFPFQDIPFFFPEPEVPSLYLRIAEQIL